MKALRLEAQVGGTLQLFGAVLYQSIRSLSAAVNPPVAPSSIQVMFRTCPSGAASTTHVTRIRRHT